MNVQESVNTSKSSVTIPKKKVKFHPWKFVLGFFSSLVILFLFLPILIVIPMSFSSASSLEFPPPGFSLRWYESFFTDPLWLEATGTSFVVAFIASLIALIIGGLATYGLSFGKFPGKNLLMGNFIAPMIIPTIVTGVSLYLAYAQIGILGSIQGLILAHTILVVPYIILITTPAFEGFDHKLELAARSLGAKRIVVFRKIIIPIILPSFLAAWLFAFIISFDEIIVTIFLAGNHFTLPKKMYNELILQINPTITAISSLLIVFTAICMMIIAFVIKKTNNKIID